MEEIIFEQKSKTFSTCVWAKVEDNKLEISCQDLGDACYVMTGEDEYEYFYSFDEENTKKLLYCLKPDAQLSDLIDLLRFVYNCGCGDMKLRKICAENDIKYSFFGC